MNREQIMVAAFVVLASILYANFIELAVHKFLFHEMGKKKNSIFAFHLRDHHVRARKNDFIDKRNTVREAGGIAFLALLHLPILYISVLAYFTIVAYGIAFVMIHHFQHSSPSFTKKYMWWHWNHHMVNPNKNWGVVSPAADYLARTLER